MSLTPAEALVLLDPMQEEGTPAVKVTFLGLMAEGVLRQEVVTGRVLGDRAGIRLARQPGSAPPHVAAVLEAVRASSSGRINDIAARLGKATRRFATFVPELVRPRLVQRGLLAETRRQEQRRMLLLFRRTVTVSSFHPTETGRREQDRIRAAIDQGPEILAALDRDPPRAAAMALALGPLLVLIPALMPMLGQLAGAMEMVRNPGGGADGGAGGDGSSGGAADGGWAEGLSALDGALDGALAEAGGDGDSDSGGDSGGSDGGGGE